MESLEEKIARALADDIVIKPYDSSWPEYFCREKEHLYSCLPKEMIRRIEHFGSTAVPNLAAKPIIDMLIEVRDLQETKERIVPVLESQGYDYFWRPTRGDDGPPFYAWFIKRDRAGIRTHHLHMVEADFEHWERLFFRDYLIERPEIAAEYQALKLELANSYAYDRVAYTVGKTEFVTCITEQAKKFYKRD